MSSPPGGTLLGQAYQLGYVTNDLDHALDILKTQYGVSQFLVSRQRSPISIEGGGEMVLEGAFAWVADLIHKVAEAYASSFGLDEAETYCAITQGLQAELACPTDRAHSVSSEN
jgi:hypothetical protein